MGTLKVLLTCEHASARIPKNYGGLGLPRHALRSHFAWDIGAATVARCLARRLGCDYFEARYSRLLIDANRSKTHPRLVPRTIGGRPIPGNTSLPDTETRQRVLRYWKPYREAVEEKVSQCVKSRAICAHFAMHSFTPRLNGRARVCDVGLLFDPRRSRERSIVEHLRAFLSEAGLSVRFNYPYKGTSDGLAAALRARVSKVRYVGVEIELNQAILRQKSRRSQLERALSSALRCLADPERPGPQAMTVKKRP